MNKFNSRSGSLFDDIELRTKWTAAFYLFYALRRIFFVDIAFNLKEWPGIQIILINYLNLAALIYVGSHQPLISLPRNRLEIFNEFMICFITFIFMGFTDVILNEDEKWDFGKIMIYLVLYFMYVNIMVILANLARNMVIMFQMIWIRELNPRLPWFKLKVMGCYDAIIE